MSTHRVTFDSIRRPEIRSNPITWYDTDRDRLCVFGGYSDALLVLGDHHEYARMSNDWLRRQPITPPSKRAWAPATYDPATKMAYLLGGTNDVAVLGDMLAYDGAQGRWSALTPTGLPAARVAHGQAYDVDRARHVLFSGLDATFAALLTDLQEYDAAGNAWSLITPDTTGIYETPPAGRFSHAMAYDATRQLTVIIGGGDAGASPIVETWLWDGVGFRRQQTVLHPPGDQLVGGSAAYVAALGGVVFHGGSAAAGTNRTWLLREDGYTEVFYPGQSIPSPRDNAGAGSDGRRFFFFGGADAGTSYNEVWSADDETWREHETGYEVDATGEINNGLRLAGSAPFPTSAIEAVDTKGVYMSAVTGFAAQETVLGSTTPLRYTIEIDGVQYRADTADNTWFAPATPSIAQASTIGALQTVIAVTPLPIAPGGSLLRLHPWLQSTDGAATPELDQFDFIGVIVRRLVTLSGAVIDANGPVQGAAVRVVPTPDQIVGDDLSVGVQEEVFTDAAGMWSIQLYETETVGSTVDLTISYTGPSGLVAQAYPGLTIPDQSTANLADLLP